MKIEELKKLKHILVLVESPNKIATIRKILNDLGLSNVVVMASVGHIMEIKDAKNSYWNTGIYPTEDFKTNFKVNEDKKDIVQKLLEQVKISNLVLIATDGDREGEAIAWSLKHFLKIPENKYQRIEFHEITKSAIKKSIENSRKIDMDLVLAATTRSRLDKLLGYRLSPIARKVLSAKSVGRCQSAGLKLIVDKEKEIINFKPETYYELTLNFVKNETNFQAKYIGTKDKKVDRIKVKDEAISVIHQCEGKNYIIDSIETKEKLNNPKPPFTTSTFQQEASSKLHISIDSAMNFAQKLFEGIDVGGEHIALITYIRTDDATMSPDFVPILMNYIKKTYGEKYCGKLKESKKKDTDQAGHECLRAIDLEMTPEKLSKYIADNKMLAVYSLIYNRTLQSIMTPAIINETIYTIKNDKHLFSMTSKELRFDGYKKVYGVLEEKDDEVIKESFVKNEVLKECILNCVEKQTQPPHRYSESSFVKELESSGVGRPSTFATIVKTILSDSRGYCKKDKGSLIPTELGMSLTDFLDKQFSKFINVEYTSEMEKDLDKIANGELKDIDFLNTFYKTMENTISEAHFESIQKPTQLSDKMCPECGKPLVIRKGKFGLFLGCSGYPKCKHIEKIEKNTNK